MMNGCILVIVGICAVIFISGAINVHKKTFSDEAGKSTAVKRPTNYVTPFDREQKQELASRLARHSESRSRVRFTDAAESNKSDVPVKRAAINTLPSLVFNEDLNLWLPDTGELPDYASGVAANRAAEFKLKLIEAHENMEFLASSLSATDDAE